MEPLIVVDSFIDKKASYERFASIQDAIRLCDSDEIDLIFTTENKVSDSFVFLFSTLPFYAKKNNKELKIFCNNKMYNSFKKLGFINDNIIFDSNFDYSSILKKNAGLITEKEHIFRTVTGIPDEAPVRMSPQLASIFISRAGEMYNNALEHSKGDVLGAKYFKNQKNTYCFACYDNGVGIPNNVMTAKQEIKSQMDAFKWAMIDGNSTANDGIPRGLGLGLLKSFVKANEGVIRIISGNVLYTYTKENDERYYQLDNNFNGTLFEMDIIADNNRKYILK